jgi:hypothetical protein
MPVLIARHLENRTATMSTIVPDQVLRDEKFAHDKIEAGVEEIYQIHPVPPLGKSREEKKFWFQRGKDYDPNAIATQVPILLSEIPQLGC